MISRWHRGGFLGILHPCKDPAHRWKSRVRGRAVCRRAVQTRGGVRARGQSDRNPTSAEGCPGSVPEPEGLGGFGLLYGCT